MRSGVQGQAGAEVIALGTLLGIPMSVVEVLIISTFSGKEAKKS